MKACHALRRLFGASSSDHRGALGADYDTTWARRVGARSIRFALVELITRPVIKTLTPPRVRNIDVLDGIEGPVIFAANHSSHIDTSIVFTTLPPRFRHRCVVAAGADYFFDKRPKAAFWALWMNTIPIEREKVGRRSADLAASLIEEGWNLVIYPEGGRTEDGFARPFRGGAAYLSIRCNVPVVPMHIGGTRRILAKGGRRVHPGPTYLTFGEPIVPAPDERARDFNRRIERAVAIAADEGATDWYSAKRRAADGTTPSLQGPEGITGWRKHWAGSAPKASGSNTRWPL